MLRAAVLSLALTLMAGPNAVLLCETWCDPHEATSAGCHHKDVGTSPGVSGDHCGNVVLSVAALVREDRRGVSVPDTRHGIVAPRYQLSASPGDAHPGDEPGREWPLAQRPFVTALRI